VGYSQCCRRGEKKKIAGLKLGGWYITTKSLDETRLVKIILSADVGLLETDG
jgi:hypothetical protein